ncbi:MAG: DNA-3-methyladenine glycosylase [Candidatus Aenigmarchaeota archaeon]|nr:DNA-3-methyladenine glycosylase [Candidatus Aenigmarchaeota archaeon]
MDMKLTEDFFARDSETVAKDLLGRQLVRQIGKRTYRGRITETGAYSGYVEKRMQEELAYPPGILYIHTGQRGYSTMAIGTEREGVPSVVTIRRLYPLEGIERPVNSPGKLTESLKIDRSLDKLSINGNDLWIEGDGVDERHVMPISDSGMASNCLGYYRLRI